VSSENSSPLSISRTDLSRMMCGPIPRMVSLLLEVARLRQFLEEVRFEVLDEILDLGKPLPQFLEGDKAAYLREPRIEP
jgi:hypothetical protein